MSVDWFWFSLVLSILLLWLAWHWPHRQTTSVTAARTRLLTPRTPADCPACGAMGRIASEGFACPNRICAVLSNHRRADPGPPR